MLSRLLVKQCIVVGLTDWSIYENKQGKWELKVVEVYDERLPEIIFPMMVSVIILCPFYMMYLGEDKIDFKLTEPQSIFLEKLDQSLFVVAKVLLLPQIAWSFSPEFLEEKCFEISIDKTIYHAVRGAGRLISRSLVYVDGQAEWQRTKQFCQRFGFSNLENISPELIKIDCEMMGRLLRLKPLKKLKLSGFEDNRRRWHFLCYSTMVAFVASLILMISTVHSFLGIFNAYKLSATPLSDVKLHDYAILRQQAPKVDWHIIDIFHQHFQNQLIVQRLEWCEGRYTLILFLNPLNQKTIDQMISHIQPYFPSSQIEKLTPSSHLKIIYQQVR